MIRLAVISNICVALLIGYILFDEYDELGAWAILFVNILSIRALSMKAEQSLKSLVSLSNIWPFILLKRLSLEEKKRIRDLEDRHDD